MGASAAGSHRSGARIRGCAQAFTVEVDEMMSAQGHKLRRLYVNRPLLAYITFVLGCGLIGFPVIAAVITTYSAWLNYAVLGALLIPVVVLGLILSRTLAWLFLSAYWTLQALVATLMLIALVAVAVLTFIEQDIVLVASEQVVRIQRIALLSILKTEPGRIPTPLFLIALLLLATSVLAFIVVRSIARRPRAMLSDTPEPTLIQVRTLDTKPLTYLEHRNTKS
jgi:hypothetical protein